MIMMMVTKKKQPPCTTRMRIDVGQAGSNSWASRQISANVKCHLFLLKPLLICLYSFYKLQYSASVWLCIWFLKTNSHCEVLDLQMSSILSQSKVFAKHGKVRTGEIARRGNVGISVPVACFQHENYFSRFFVFIQLKKKCSSCSVEWNF